MHLIFRVLLAICVFLAVAVEAQNFSPPKILSVDQNGNVQSGDSTFPSVSANATIAVFESGANLIPGAPTQTSNVFLSEVDSNGDPLLSLVNLNDDGSVPQSSNFASKEAAIAPVFGNGCIVITFASDHNLEKLPPDSGVSDIFIRVPPNPGCNLPQMTKRVTVGCERRRGCSEEQLRNSNGNSFASSVAVLPPNQIRVALSSSATNLTPDQTDNHQDIYVVTFTIPKGRKFDIERDREIRQITLAADGPTNDDSEDPVISGNGRFIVFESRATNLKGHENETGGNITKQLYIYDYREDETRIISGSPTDDQNRFGNGDSYHASISFDGRFISYSSHASNIVPNTPAGNYYVYLLDSEKGGQVGETTLINVNPTSGEVSNGLDTGQDLFTSLSPDSRFLAFSDRGSNLVDGDTNGVADIFLKDLENGSLVRASVGPSQVEADGGSFKPSLGLQSFNSSTVNLVYNSFATNLVSGISTGGNEHIYRTVITFDPPQLDEETEIIVPPDVEVEDTKVQTELKAFSSSTSSLGDDVDAATETEISYRVVLRREGKRRRRRDLRRRTVKSNQVTFRRLRSGNYNLKYRVKETQGNKTITRTNFSPASKFNVSK